MGLFVAEDGSFQGWLAAFLCCCAAVNDDEYPRELRRQRSPSGMCADQPQFRHSFQTPFDQYSPTSVNSLYQYHGSISDHDLLQSQSDRPPSLKPLDLGDSSLLGRMSPSIWRRSYSAPAGQMIRLSSATTDRLSRVDLINVQRASLVPLKLSPVVLRQSSSENVDQCDPYVHRYTNSSDSLVDSSKRTSPRFAKDTPSTRLQQHVTPPVAVPPPSGQRHMDPIEEDLPLSRPALSAQSSFSSISSSRNRPVESSASSVMSRQSTDRKRSKRKRSLQSIVKSSSEISDWEIDKEILELNTIVEERRAENAQPKSPVRDDDETVEAGVQHFSAVAPSMAIRARSETLTSIGSAFARPKTAHSTTTPTAARLSRPIEHIPDFDARPATAHGTALHSTSRDSSISRDANLAVTAGDHPNRRISGWLSTLLTPIATSDPIPNRPAPAPPSQQDTSPTSPSPYNTYPISPSQATEHTDQEYSTPMTPNPNTIIGATTSDHTSSKSSDTITATATNSINRAPPAFHIRRGNSSSSFRPFHRNTLSSTSSLNTAPITTAPTTPAQWSEPRECDEDNTNIEPASEPASSTSLHQQSPTPACSPSLSSLHPNHKTLLTPSGRGRSLRPGNRPVVRHLDGADEQKGDQRGSATDAHDCETREGGKRLAASAATRHRAMVEDKVLGSVWQVVTSPGAAGQVGVAI